jgi:hypothetical protein
MPAREHKRNRWTRMLKPVRLAGHVIRKRINVGSKSDHEAVVLVCTQGEFKLRRRGGPAFVDDALDPLVGKRIRASGIVSAGQFIVDAIEVTGDA